MINKITKIIKITVQTTYHTDKLHSFNLLIQHKELACYDEDKPFFGILPGKWRSMLIVRIEPG